MGRGKLTTEEQAILRANPNVESVDDYRVFYTGAFKKHFVDAYTSGKRPKQIFIDAGFDPEILGDKRIERATARWKERHIRDNILASIDQEAAKEALQTIDAIDDLKKAKEKLTKQEKIIQQQAAEIEALKKAGWLGGRRCDKKAYGTTDLCKIVEETVQAYGKAVNIKALCKNLHLPRSTYYYYKASKENRQRREDADREALYFIQKAFDHSGKYYHKGSRSLRMVLKNDYDIIYNRKKIQRIMRKYQLICPVKKSPTLWQTQKRWPRKQNRAQPRQPRVQAGRSQKTLPHRHHLHQTPRPLLLRLRHHRRPNQRTRRLQNQHKLQPRLRSGNP